MKVALLVEDQREQMGAYSSPRPVFHPAVEALLAGLGNVPELEVHLISCLRAPAPALPQLGPRINYHPLVVPKIGWLSTGYQGCIRAVRRKLREIQPDLVHGQGTERNCAMEAVFSGYPNVITLHGNMREVARYYRAKPWSYHGLTARLESFCLQRTAGVLCNSGHTEAQARPLARRCWRVPNAVRPLFLDTPQSEPQSPASRRVLNIGTITRYKRQLEVLDLAEQMHREGDGLEFLFLGGIVPDAYGEAFKERIAEAQAAGYARHLGTLPAEQMVPLLDECGAMLHLSGVESFGLAVAEGLARNLKFFGLRVGGVEDIASGVEGAELFAPEDAAGLREAIARWAKTGCPKPAEAYRAMQERYHPELVARRHLAIYREVLEPSNT